MTDETPRKAAYAVIANALDEFKSGPRNKLRTIVKALGDEAAYALLHEVQQIEEQGGMLLPDGSRRRTPGGIYFHLAYQRLTPEQQQEIYGYRRQKKSDKPDKQESLPLETWADRGNWIEEARSIQEASTVKITLIGPLEQATEKQGFTLAMLKHTPRLDTLPKGIPRPEPVETSYVVYIGSKQWKKVKEALQDPDDVAIIEGTPMWDHEYQAVAVFATNITTKLMQQAKRAPKEEAG
jgi:hypothetical protein